MRMWSKKSAAKQAKRQYKTAAEVLEASGGAPAQAPATTILDMRGPQARVVTNLEHLNSEHVRLPHPGLHHGLQFLPFSKLIA